MTRSIATIFGNVFAIFGRVLRSQALQSLWGIYIKNNVGLSMNTAEIGLFTKPSYLIHKQRHDLKPGNINQPFIRDF